MTAAALHQLIVCEACTWPTAAIDHPTDENANCLTGADLLAALQALHQRWPYRDQLSLKTTSCLCICDNPCAIAFVGRQKPSFLFGDLDPETTAADLLTAAALYVESEDGMVPLYQLPKSLRPHRIARLPPAP
ncbi:MULTISPECIES: DUF1636 family protein [Cyanophyceae]|uniref:DUF1636 family protein n=1 Tax=Cyanophyceae TaxID=3028117 RepID=UPI00016DC375|nr:MULTISPECIES: DUF1636 family protein [Cyanophyceae]ACB01141.1 conserved hypothetical protein [Picosynechococcus sp. PCC 7002]SMH48215.1 Predicted metal-binding protein [Picosynechococcus sp. OG1]SMQ81257.1 Predicted metal-binding protein [Synechococcus sp. 7002]